MRMFSLCISNSRKPLDLVPDRRERHFLIVYRYSVSTAVRHFLSAISLLFLQSANFRFPEIGSLALLICRTLSFPL